MSEYEIPFDIQEEIMKRLPVKSLIQFRSVSKAWKSLIDSSEFIAAHSLTQQQHLLVSYQDLQEEEKYVCYIDDDTFPQQRCLLTLPPPLSAELFIAVDSSHGLLCFHVLDPNFTNERTVVWNPSVRKYIVVAVPEKLYGVGFGVCPVTNDPKIVSITQSFWDPPEGSYKDEVMVYTLSSGKWTSLSTNLPTKRIQHLSCSVVTDGFIYWCVGTWTHNMIMSFDVTNESFEEIVLPDTLARHDPYNFRISKLRGSLAMLGYRGNICTVWMMANGVQRTFTKLFTITTPYDRIVGFRKSGVPIMKVRKYDDANYDEKLDKLVVYEPNSEHNNVLEVSTSNSFYVNSYKETLLLLGRSDCISY